MPSPQLKLIVDNLFGGMTRPPAPETPGLPLESPSKKIVADDLLNQKEMNTSLSPRYLQEGENTGLIRGFPTTIEQDPNRKEAGREDTGWPINSTNHDNALKATS